MTTGQMVAVYLPEFHNEWPQIGKILNIADGTIILHWFSGTTTSKWTHMQQRSKGVCESYTGTAPISSIVTPSFGLTRTEKLPQEIQRILREKQEELYAE